MRTVRLLAALVVVCLAGLVWTRLAAAQAGDGKPTAPAAAPADASPPDGETHEAKVPEVRVRGLGSAGANITASIGLMLGVAFSLAILLAAQLYVAAVHPGALDRVHDATAGRHPLLPVVVGAVTTIGLLFLWGVGVQGGPAGGLLAAGATVALLAAIVPGLAARSQDVGRRLLSPDRVGGRGATVAFGGAVLLGTAALPFLGQVMGLWWIASAVGGTVLALLAPPRGAAAAPRG